MFPRMYLEMQCTPVICKSELGPVTNSFTQESGKYIINLLFIILEESKW